MITPGRGMGQSQCVLANEILGITYSMYCTSIEQYVDTPYMTQLGYPNQTSPTWCVYSGL